MFLSKVIEPLTDVRLMGGDVEINGITYDSRKVEPGTLFVAFKGGTFDGHDFIPDAVARGASAVVVEKEVETSIPTVIVPDSRAALSLLAANFFGYPSRKMTLVGVTGTNGKTTTTHLVQSIYQAAGKKSGLIGTLGARINNQVIETEHTTPESSDLQRVLVKMVDEGVEVVTMEVSSHGLVQGRTDYCEFDCGIFTNLTQDHLDFHGSIDEYRKAKLMLFSDYPAKSDKKFCAAVNADDSSAQLVIEAVKGTVITYGINSDADVKGSDIEVSPSSVSFVISYGGSSERVTVPMGGYFNVYNSLGAAAACLGLGIDLQAVIAGLSNAPKVAGRFESVDCGQDFGVLVDYAHTPDGLENVLRTARKITDGQLIVVFGCGGNRDRGKRPIMGEIAAKLADIVVITSDNPRKEDPTAIIRDILSGISLDVTPKVFIDRREAIEYAIKTARKGDLVVIAGKGHEDYQIFADKTIHFDDREVAREILANSKR